MVAILISLASIIARGIVGEDATENARCKETSPSLSFVHSVITNMPRHARGSHREENGNPVLHCVDSGGASALGPCVRPRGVGRPGYTSRLSAAAMQE